jgi:hypothetical protein
VEILKTKMPTFVDFFFSNCPLKNYAKMPSNYTNRFGIGFYVKSNAQGHGQYWNKGLCEVEMRQT